MLKVNNSRKSKMTKKQYLIALGALVTGMAFTSPVSTLTVHAEEEVLFEDTTDDYKTEDIQEEDIVRDNTVVEPEQPKQEEPKQEEKKEEKKNKCITEDNGYDEEAGKYWDPSIKTEPEKKGLEPEEPTPEEPTPEEPTPEQPQPSPEQPQPSPVQPAPNPTPAPAPKTGDLSVAEILGLLAGLSIGGYGIGNLYANAKSKKRK